jgi:hypothetical protein
MMEKIETIEDVMKGRLRELAEWVECVLDPERQPIWELQDLVASSSNKDWDEEEFQEARKAWLSGWPEIMDAHMVNPSGATPGGVGSEKMCRDIGLAMLLFLIGCDVDKESPIDSVQ